MRHRNTTPPGPHAVMNRSDGGREGEKRFRRGEQRGEGGEDVEKEGKRRGWKEGEGRVEKRRMDHYCCGFSDICLLMSLSTILCSSS